MLEAAQEGCALVLADIPHLPASSGRTPPSSSIPTTPPASPRPSTGSPADARLHAWQVTRAQARAALYAPQLQAARLTEIYAQALAAAPDDVMRPPRAVTRETGARRGDRVMRFVFYTHSLTSDWNHGNAHFPARRHARARPPRARGRGAGALRRLGAGRNLAADQGFAPLDRFEQDFPELEERLYENGFDHAAALEGADVVIVHEWTDPRIVAEIGWLRREGAPFALLFHDTHHRAVSAQKAIAGLELRDYDGVLRLRRGAQRALPRRRLGPAGAHLARGPPTRACSGPRPRSRRPAT